MFLSYLLSNLSTHITKFCKIQHLNGHIPVAYLYRTTQKQNVQLIFNQMMGIIKVHILCRFFSIICQTQTHYCKHKVENDNTQFVFLSCPSAQMQQFLLSHLKFKSNSKFETLSDEQICQERILSTKCSKIVINFNKSST